MFSRLVNFVRGVPKPAGIPEDTHADWSFLGADMHSHFLPGIDDGAKTLEESLALVRAMVDMGYKTIITTPHTMIDFYPNTTQSITNAFNLLRDAIKAQNIPVSIKAASEYYIDEHFIHLLDTEPLLTIYNNEVLVEFSMLYPPPMLHDVLFKMISSGYRPVIAHPERYGFLHNNFNKYSEMRDRGCLFQLNMLSVSGYYGRNIKNVALQLLSKNMYDYCGSDAHHQKHAEALRNITGTKDYFTFAQYPFLNPRLCF